MTPQIAISLRLDDLYTVDEPIVLRARLFGLPDSAPGNLKAAIKSVSSDQSVLKLNFMAQEQEVDVGDRQFANRTVSREGSDRKFGRSGSNSHT